MFITLRALVPIVTKIFFRPVELLDWMYDLRLSQR
jgi:hypothetical protein